jgi:pilus assembly protein Flp/PilA
MATSMLRFVREEEGATALEYGLLAALIAAAIIGAVTTLGSTVSNTFQSIANSMSLSLRRYTNGDIHVEIRA